MSRYQPSGWSPGAATRARAYLLLALLPVLPASRRARALYEMESTHNLLTERTLYRNLGYWRERPADLDEACEAMAFLLGEAAGICPGDVILDAGFGFADQDIFWAKRFSPTKIVGIDIVPSHLSLAQRRIRELGLEECIELQLKSAIDMNFPPDSFDAVVALESALHFITRERFFGEALRVLRPGRQLALVEPIPMTERRGKKSSGHLGRSIGATPEENFYPLDVYANKLRDAGFVDVSVTSIRDDVFPGFMDDLEKKLEDREVAERVNAAVRLMWRGWVVNWRRAVSAAEAGDQDYVLAVARKPAVGDHASPDPTNSSSSARSQDRIG